jgi:DNA-binding transcriptional MerR regulator
MYTISRLGGLCGVSRSTLLYYDSIGLLSPAQRSGSGYRLYSEEDRERLERIVMFRDLGVPLERISDFLKNPGQGPTALLLRRIGEINGQIQDLRSQQKMILDLMEEDGTLKGIKPVLHTLKELGEKAGIDEGNYLKFHGKFENTSPDLHRRLLSFLGFNKNEIKELLKKLKQR